jgi:hypothetical protein
MKTVKSPRPKNQFHLKASSALNSRLTRYFSISVGACAVGFQESFADIVNINVGASGFNINGVNAGVNSYQGVRTIYNFPINGSLNNLVLSNQRRVSIYSSNPVTGVGGGLGNVEFAVTALSNASIKKFTSPDSIFSNSIFTNKSNFSAFKYGSTSVGNFTTSNYVGFRFGTTGSYNYGWLQTTWDGTNFQINSGAYESTVNTAILAGAAAPVPEPGTLALGSLALLAGGGAAVRRYRKQRQQQATTPTAEPAPEGAEAEPVA